MELNSNNLLIDANVWISYLDKDDSHYSRSGILIHSHIKHQSNLLLLTDYIIQEVITLFLYKRKPELVEEFIRLIHRETYIEILAVDSYFLASILDFIKQQQYLPKISLTDWSLLFLASEFDLKLVTFDKQLNNAYNKLARQ
jgi:predicted nucleic acid-binding protein